MTWNVIDLSSSDRSTTWFAVVFTSEHIPQAWIACLDSDESQYYATRVRKLIAESDLPMKQRWFIQQVQKELFFWPLLPRSTDIRQFFPNRRSQKQELNVWPPTHAVITKGIFISHSFLQNVSDSELHNRCLLPMTSLHENEEHLFFASVAFFPQHWGSVGVWLSGTVGLLFYLFQSQQWSGRHSEFHIHGFYYQRRIHCVGMINVWSKKHLTTQKLGCCSV